MYLLIIAQVSIHVKWKQIENTKPEKNWNVKIWNESSKLITDKVS